jgi:hypothetical protein
LGGNCRSHTVDKAAKTGKGGWVVVVAAALVWLFARFGELLRFFLDGR